MVEEIKKKRGRKPKHLTTPKIGINANVASTESLKKLKEKKHKVIFSFDNMNKESSSDTDDNCILKLKINNNNNNNITGLGHCLNNESSHECIGAYNEYFLSQYSSLNNEAIIPDVPDEYEENIKKIGNNKVIELLRDFDKKAKNNEWPLSTSVNCFWCCHTFDTPPVGLPCKYYNNRFYVTGCFCSLECASAFNIMQLKDSNLEERNNLINYLSHKMGYDTIVKCAPPREMLKIFGGSMDIDEFRSYNNVNKSIQINFPPMTVLINQFEEINDSDIYNSLKYIPLDVDRVDKYKEKIKLQRLQPINNNINTLENVMQFSIK